MTHGSLFAGIGGFDLGFERAGIKAAWQVESDDYCLKLLEKHFPNAERFKDIRECGARNLKPVDIISGGFPCVDISYAGKGAGIEGGRSGLWSEMARIIRELRPRFVVVENTPALLGRGMGRVLGGLPACGYDAEWDCLPAAVFGASHLRDRTFIVAYVNSIGEQQPQGSEQEQRRRIGYIFASPHADTDEARFKDIQGSCPSGVLARWRMLGACDWWATEPDVVRMVHGVPRRVDRISGLGNAVVPQIAEWIARRILTAEAVKR